VKREEVDRRVKEDTETYSSKFTDDAKCCCMQVYMTRLLQLLPPFYSHYTGQPALAGNAVKNWRTLLEHSFTACMPLVTAASAFRLGRIC